MKPLKVFGTLLLCLLLLCSTVLTLASGLLSFVVLRPAFYKAFVPSKAYCDELRARIGENLDHVAILYGLDEGALTDVVTDADIRAYTAALTDALFDSGTTDTLALPPYPAEGFADYLRAHTSYSEQAVSDFSEDCAASVTGDLSAVDVGLLVSGVSRIRSSRLASLAPVLFLAAFVFGCALIALLLAVHTHSPRAGRVAVLGALFMGLTVVFVPLSQFWLFDYIGRLNISISAFRTILSGFLNTALYGCLAVSGALLLVVSLLLLLACRSAARPHRQKNAR